MNWKAEAMEKLGRYYAMRQALQNIPEELSRLEADAKLIRSASTEKVAAKSSGGKREDRLMNNIVQRQELINLLQQAKSWVKVTEKALAILSPEEKLVLHRMYILPEKDCIERLMAELGVEQASIYRKREKALRHFTTALYGVPEV